MREHHNTPWTSAIKQPAYIAAWLETAYRYNSMAEAWENCTDVYWLLDLLELLGCKDERLRLVGCRILRELRNPAVNGGEQAVMERYDNPSVRNVVLAAERYAEGVVSVDRMLAIQKALLDEVEEWDIGIFEAQRIAKICDPNPLSALRAAVGLRFPITQREDRTSSVATTIVTMLRAAYTPKDTLEQFHAALDKS